MFFCEYNKYKKDNYNEKIYNDLNMYLLNTHGLIVLYYYNEEEYKYSKY